MSMFVGLEDEQDDAAPRAERREIRYDDDGLDSEDDFIDFELSQQAAQLSKPCSCGSILHTSVAACAILSPSSMNMAE